MADVTKPYTFTNQTTADANQVNQDFDTLYTAVNGGLDNNNIKTGSLSTAIATEGVTQSQTKGVPYAIDLYGGPFLFSGFTVTKDGTTLTQVNVTAGVALTKQSDGNLRRITTSATNFRVATNSTTYYLDLNPDGSWWWANSGHSTAANYINVATVTSDGSGNVATVTQNTSSYQFDPFSDATGSPNYLRTDSGAPDPQTVANPVKFNSVLTIEPSSTLGSTSGSEQDILSPIVGTGTNAVYLKTRARRTANGTDWQTTAIDVIRVTDSTEQQYMTFKEDGQTVQFSGPVSTSSGQLGSASGTWAPANGTFNVALGTVINVSSVPSGAKRFQTIVVGGSNANTNASIGLQTSSGSAWMSYQSSTSAGQNVATGYTSAISASTATGSTLTLYDGTYLGIGYFQINNGYLQFVMTAAGGASANAQNSIRWGVS